MYPDKYLYGSIIDEYRYSDQIIDNSRSSSSGSSSRSQYSNIDTLICNVGLYWTGHARPAARTHALIVVYTDTTVGHLSL